MSSIWAQAGSKWVVASRDRVSDGPLLSEVIVPQPLRVTQMNEREQGDNKEESNQGMDWQQKEALEFAVKCPQFNTPDWNCHNIFVNQHFVSKQVKKVKYVCDDNFYELS